MNKKILIKILILAFILMILGVVLYYFCVNDKLNGAVQLYSVNIKKVPSYEQINGENIGFTCTGLYYDENEQLFYVGNIGKYKPEEKTFKATIEIIDSSFENILETITLYDKYPNIKDIQGITKDSNDNIWFCSPAENLIRLISKDGNEISKISVKNPSGIAYDKEKKNLWVLTDKFLINYSTKGDVIKKFFIKEKGQDQLYIDESKILFTAGLDYNGDSYIYEVDKETGKYKIKYILKDSFAIEGISIVDNNILILNDGYYHNAKVAENQLNYYSNIKWKNGGK